MSERKIQVIPGGTSGMGLETAKALSQYGPVLIGGRNEERLEKAIAYLKESGVEAYGKTVDISDRDSLKAFADYAVSIAPIGNVVNSAAIDAGPTELIWKINVQGTVNVVETFLPYMDHSCMVNFSSVTGYFYFPTQEEMAVWSAADDPDFEKKSYDIAMNKQLDPRMEHMGVAYKAYVASKRFVMYYTQANALRFARKNSQIISVAPGSFDTPMLRENNDPANIKFIENSCVFGRLGKSEEMADFVCKLVSPGHEYLTGVDLVLDGGLVALASVKQYD